MPVKKFDHPDHGWVWTELELRWINDRIAAEVAAEREACAKLCDDDEDQVGSALACYIRDRSSATGENDGTF